MRDLGKVTHVDGVSYCDVCGYCIDALDMCSPQCATQRRKQPSARAEPKQPKVSLEDIAAAFERNKG